MEEGEEGGRDRGKRGVVLAGSNLQTTSGYREDNGAGFSDEG